MALPFQVFTITSHQPMRMRGKKIDFAQSAVAGHIAWAGLRQRHDKYPRLLRHPSVLFHAWAYRFR